MSNEDDPMCGDTHHDSKDEMFVFFIEFYKFINFLLEIVPLMIFKKHSIKLKLPGRDFDLEIFITFNGFFEFLIAF